MHNEQAMKPTQRICLASSTEIHSVRSTEATAKSKWISLIAATRKDPKTKATKLHQRPFDRPASIRSSPYSTVRAINDPSTNAAHEFYYARRGRSSLLLRTTSASGELSTKIDRLVCDKRRV